MPDRKCDRNDRGCRAGDGFKRHAVGQIAIGTPALVHGRIEDVAQQDRHGIDRRQAVGSRMAGDDVLDQPSESLHGFRIAMLVGVDHIDKNRLRAGLLDFRQ